MFPRTPVIDAFNRSNEGPPPSSSWSRGFSNLFGQWRVVGNQCAVDALSYGYCLNYWNAATYGPACSAYATVVTKPADGTRLSIYFRMNAISDYTTAYGYALQVRCESGTDTWELVRYDAGASTAVVGSAIAQELSNGDSIGVKAVGSRFEIWHKPSGGSWTLLGVRTDVSYNVAGYMGIMTTSAATVLDDVGAGTDTILWEESFENAGYELSGWTEYVDTNSVVNEDWAYTNPLPGRLPANSAGSSCLRIVRGASPDTLCGTLWDWDGYLATSRIYARVYVMFTGESLASDTISDLFFRVSQGSEGSTCFGAALRKSSSGALSFRAGWHESDGLHYGTSDCAISLNRWYRVELYAERVGAGADCWTLRVNGTNVESRTNCTFDRLLGGVRLGPYGNLNYCESESYYDLLALSASDWCGPEAGETETLSGQAVSVSSVSDLQAFVESLSSAIASQDSIIDVRQMLEALAETITAQTTVTDIAVFVENVSVVAQTVASIADVQAYIESVSGVIQSADSVTDVLGVIETLTMTITSSDSVTDQIALAEILTATIASTSSLDDIQVFAESLTSAVTSISSAADLQLFLENLQIMAASSASLTEIQAYIESVSTTAQSGSSLTDVLVGGFVGTYIIGSEVPVRQFTQEVPEISALLSVPQRSFSLEVAAL